MVKSLCALANPSGKPNTWDAGEPEGATLLLLVQVGGVATEMANDGSAADFWESLTLMMMLLSVPTSAAAGVPESVPFVLLKLAHAGLFWMLKLTGWPEEFWTVGVNEYGRPTWAFVEGVPLIVGAGALPEEPVGEETVGEEPPMEVADEDGRIREGPLPPQPAVTLKMTAHSTHVLVFRWLLDIRLSSTVNAKSRAQSAIGPDSPSDHRITVDDKSGIDAGSSSATPLSRAADSRPEALRPRLAAGLPRAAQFL
jgi:hypothetical protein